MSRASAWSQIVARCLMAPLFALWPVLCCCTLPSRGPFLARGAVAECHAPGSDGASDGGGCHGGGSEQDCSCPTALSTLADIAPASFDVPDFVVVGTLCFPGIVTAGAWRAALVTRVEHPPPIVRRGRRVLRI